MAMGVLLVAGAKPKYIALISVLSLSTVALGVRQRLVNQYQIERLRVFVDQDTSDPQLQDSVYQLRNAIRAIATGGLWGKGWLEGPLTNGRDIPVQWADFPFSAVGEQFGLVGCSALLLLFVLALLRIWRIASLSKRHARHLPVRRRVHDDALAGVPERRDDARHHARDRAADAVHLVRRDRA